ASLLCPGADCAECARGDTPKMKASFLAFDVELGSTRILDLSAAGYRAVKSLGRDKATSYVLRLARNGTGFATQYTADTVRPITDEDRRAIDGAAPLDLEDAVLGDARIAATVRPIRHQQSGAEYRHGPAADDDDMPY